MSLNKNLSYNFIITGANILFPLITFPYVSRVLNPEGLGSYFFGVALASVFFLISDFGLKFYGVREVARVRDSMESTEKTLSSLLWLNLIATLVAVVLVIPALYFSNLSNYIFPCTLAIVGNTLNLLWVFQGLERFKELAIRTIVVRLIFVILTFFLIQAPEDAVLYFYLYSIAILVNGFVSVVYLEAIGFSFLSISRKFELTKFRYHISLAWILFASTLAIGVYTQVDSIMLKYLASDEAVGYYAASLKVIKIILGVITSAGVVMLSRTSANIGQGNLDNVRKAAKTSFQVLSAVCFAGAVGVFVISEELILLFSGKEFLPAHFTMQILSFLIIVISFSNLFGMQLLMPAGKERAFTIAVSTGCITNILLNFILIPKWSYEGAAISTLIAEVVVTTITFMTAKRHLRLDLDFNNAGRFFVISMTFIPLGLFVDYFKLALLISLLFKIIVCVITYFTLNLIFQKEQTLALIKLIKERK